MEKKFLLLLIIFFLGGGFLLVETAQADSGDNVSGWAWSANIGWISFNNTTGGGTTNYGVHIDPTTGNFSGWAWSENIGWISFNRGETGAPPNDDPCPDGSCIAYYDSGNNEVSGWARACGIPLGGSAIQCGGDGWDGWIKLRNTNYNYGIWIDTSSGPPYEFRDYAWGSDPDDYDEAVIGWDSFNCKEGGNCLSSDYKVTYTPSAPPNQDPEAETPSEAQSYVCRQSAGGPQSPMPSLIVKFQWSYNDDDGDPQDSYRLQIYDNSGYNPPAFYDTGRSTNLPLTEQEVASPILDFNTPYWWQVTVWDDKGGVSDPTDARRSFTTMESPPYPKFECIEAEGSGQQSCDSINPDVGEDITFVNLTDYCDTNCNYKWDFNNNKVWESSAQNPPPQPAPSSNYTVVLRAEDDDGYCVTEHPITVTAAGLPLPKWREIPPF